jgi:hypothetical protein
VVARETAASSARRLANRQAGVGTCVFFSARVRVLRVEKLAMRRTINLSHRLEPPMRQCHVSRRGDVLGEDCGWHVDEVGLARWAARGSCEVGGVNTAA